MPRSAEVRSAVNEGSTGRGSLLHTAFSHTSAAGRINGSRAKRIFDLVVASLALVLLSPLLLLVAAAIRLDSRGPVFYRQRRYGRGGTFMILKFRTMTAEASNGAFRQAVVGDSRITRVGKLLRRTNIDELPQLINVIVGDMSLIGPRPHPIALDDWFSAAIPELMRRYAVRPGITGWAQVNGLRGETPGVEHMAARVRHDLEYVRSWSLWLDLVICWRTVFHKKAFENAR